MRAGASNASARKLARSPLRRVRSRALLKAVIDDRVIVVRIEILECGHEFRPTDDERAEKRRCAECAR